jgi:hypothetical protein
MAVQCFQRCTKPEIKKGGRDDRKHNCVQHENGSCWAKWEGTEKHFSLSDQSANLQTWTFECLTFPGDENKGKWGCFSAVKHGRLINALWSATCWLKNVWNTGFRGNCIPNMKVRAFWLFQEMKTKGNNSVFLTVCQCWLNRHSQIGHLLTKKCLKHKISEGNCTPENEHSSVLTFFGNENKGKYGSFSDGVSMLIESSFTNRLFWIKMFGRRSLEAIALSKMRIRAFWLFSVIKT